MKSRFAFLTLLAAALTLLSVTTLVQAQLIGARHPGPAPETEDEAQDQARNEGREGHTIPCAKNTTAVVGSKTGDRELLATGQCITPTAAPGSTFQQLATGLRSDGTADADGAYSSVLSPDGKTLLVLTNGFNAGYFTPTGEQIKFPYLDPINGQPSATLASSFQWIFVFDVSSGTPIKQQQINIPSTYAGLAWDPSGSRFYVSGGQEDRVYIYKRSQSEWVPDAPFILLNHNSNGTNPKPNYDGASLATTPAGQSENGKLYGLVFGAMTVGVGVSADGREVYAVNMQNDSISIIDADNRQVISEVRLFTPGATEPRGEYPMWVTPHAGPHKATDKIYVSSQRDGQVVVISRPDGQQKVIDVGGEPTKMVLSPNGRYLYVVNPDLDEVEEINTADDILERRLSLQRPGYHYRGSNPNSLALTADGESLYVTLGGENAVAVVDLRSARVRGRIPTAWYPTTVTLSSDEQKLYIFNFKSTPGPNTDGGQFVVPDNAYARSTNPTFQNQYNEALQKSGLLTMPIPSASTLRSLSRIVDANNGFTGGQHAVSPMMRFLQAKIKHVIYVMKENRSYDQMLGDLPVGNGDPRLAYFPQAVTPNLHALAEQFVDLDNFYVASESSGDGWQWVTQGHANEYAEIVHQFNDASGFLALDFLSLLGTPRGMNLALPITAEDPSLTTVRATTVFDPSGSSTILPGAKNIAVAWGADHDEEGETGGYIWDSVLRAGKSVRHYGLWTDSSGYYQFNGDFSNTYFVTPTPETPNLIPIARDAAARGIVQAAPIAPGLVGRTDPYYRGWDLNEPDEFRYEEWKREFDEYVRNGDLPTFEPMLLMMDHTGNFKANVAGLNTPELEVASNDHAVGLLIDAVSHSPYWKDTAIFIVEDDSLDGPDHVESHRSPGYVISAYTKRRQVVSTFYNTVSMVRTIADILGVDHLGLNDENAASMDDVFTTEPDFTPYDHAIPGNLLRPPVDPQLVTAAERSDPRVSQSTAIVLRHDGDWWAAQARSMNFNRPDAVEPVSYNRLLWRGIVGEAAPYPEERSRIDLRRNRMELLRRVQPPVGPALTAISDRME